MPRYMVLATTEDFKSYNGKKVTVVRVMNVADPREYPRKFVWIDEDGTASCCSCQGKLTPMSESCPHSRAAKRAFLAKKIVPLDSQSKETRQASRP
jgi:hypothetical protein